MASEAEVSEQVSSLFERLFRQREWSLFLPFILGLTSPTQESPQEESTERTSTSGTPQERIILVNPFTQGMVVIEGDGSNLETLLRDLSNKSGHPPASKESIEAMPSLEIGEGEDKEECVVCLEEWEVGGVVKVMPCNHKFHPNCIEKWLGIHGSCPVCRYKMPVEEEVGKKRVEEEGGDGVRRMPREIWVSFSFNGSRQNQGEVDVPESGSSDGGVDPSSAASSSEAES